MRKRSVVQRALGVVAGAAMLAVMAPTAAHADVCSGYWGVNDMTIGVGGNDIATTPELHIEVCVVANGDPTLIAPTPEVDTTPSGGRKIMLHHQYGSPTQIGISYQYSVSDSPRSGSFVIPVGGGDGSSTCVAYIGSATYNPGGCLIYLDQ